MVNSASRVRVAALILCCAGLASVIAPATASAQPWRETPSAALARNMRALADSPKDFEALVGAGKAALEIGDTQAAVGFFGRADEVHPNSPVPQIGMGAAAVADGNPQQALAYFNRAGQLGANGAMMGKDRGLAFDLLGRHSEAQADYRAAMFGSDADEARRRLALSLAVTGDKAAALEMLGPLMAKGDAAGARCRALVLALSGDMEGARRSIEVAMPGSGGQMAPFLAKLPSLRSDQKAAAVNLGIFPDSGQGVSYAYAAPVASSPSIGTSSYVATTNPVTGDRLASIEQLLRPQAAAPAVAAPVRVAAVPSRQRAIDPTPASAPVTSLNKQRFWVQLASGRNPSALPEEFRRIKTRHKDLLEGVNGYVAQDRDRARLVIGPFKDASEADIFAEDLESVSVDAFSWSSPPGQAVRKLSTE